MWTDEEVNYLRELTENAPRNRWKKWTKASNRELFAGHLHHELIKDEGGILHRQMPTLKKPDQWHEDNGFTMASDRFQLVTYTEKTTEKVIYM